MRSGPSLRREKECTDVFLREASWKTATLKVTNLGSCKNGSDSFVIKGLKF